MSFRRSLPEIRCAIIYWTTTIPYDGAPPHPFQEMHAGVGSCELLGDVHHVHVRQVHVRTYGPGPILFTQSKSLGRRSPGCASIGDGPSSEWRQPTESGLSTSHNPDFGPVASGSEQTPSGAKPAIITSTKHQISPLAESRLRNPCLKTICSKSSLVCRQWWARFSPCSTPSCRC